MWLCGMHADNCPLELGHTNRIVAFSFILWPLTTGVRSPITLELLKLANSCQ